MNVDKHGAFQTNSTASMWSVGLVDWISIPDLCQLITPQLALQPVAARTMDSATTGSRALGSASVKRGGRAASVTLRQVCPGGGHLPAALCCSGPRRERPTEGGGLSDIGKKQQGRGSLFHEE